MSDQLTLPEIETKLRWLVNELARVQKELAKARDDEVLVRQAWQSKRRRALMSDRCPRTGRGEGTVTVAERDAWVDMQCEEEEQVFQLAEVKRESAQDHLRVLRDQAVLVSALAKSVQISMGLAGTSQPEWSRH